MSTEDSQRPAHHLIRISKFLSLVLRHQPQKIGLQLDAHGWADVDDLIERCGQHGQPLSRLFLEELVANNDKQRLAFSEDKRRIRASQGHSIDVDLALVPTRPPDLLFHGTASRFLDSIRATGLHSASRQHVHLSRDIITARKVGQRHGSPVTLTVLAGEMFHRGHLFYLSANGVWLTDLVPVKFLQFPEDRSATES